MRVASMYRSDDLVRGERAGLVINNTFYGHDSLRITQNSLHVEIPCPEVSGRNRFVPDCRELLTEE